MGELSLRFVLSEPISATIGADKLPLPIHHRRHKTPAMPQHETPKGQRGPRDTDLQPILDLIWEGKSLSSACRELGLNIPTASAWLHADPERETQYTRAREGRALGMQEEVLLLSKAASMGKTIEGSRIDAAALRVHLDAVKWATGQMAPKMTPPERREVDVRYPDLTTDELKARALEKMKRLLGDGEPSE